MNGHLTPTMLISMTFPKRLEPTMNSPTENTNLRTSNIGRTRVNAGTVITSIGLAVLALGAPAAATMNSVTPTPQPEPPAVAGAARTTDGGVGGESVEKVEFISKGVGPISFTMTGKPHTGPKQPFGGANFTTEANGDLAGSIKATLGTTDPVASWFNSTTENSDPNSNEYGPKAELAYGSLDKTPSALSFAFQGNLTIDGTKYPINIGQGYSFPLTRNWWLGGAAGDPNSSTSSQWSDWSVFSTTPFHKDLRMFTPDGQYMIKVDGSHTFIVEASPWGRSAH